MVRQIFAKCGYAALKAGLRLPEAHSVKRFSEQGI